MPKRPPPIAPEARNRLKAEIVHHVATGAPLTAVLTLPGMPPWFTVRSWRKRDASFDQDLAQAIRRGKYRRFDAYDEALGRAVIIRYAAGESLRRIADDPTMPTLERIERWRATELEFGAEIHRLKAIQAQLRREALAVRPVYWPYDQAVADHILVRLVRGEKLRALLAGDPALPGMDTIKRWRQEQPVFDRELAVSWRSGLRRRNRARRRTLFDDQLAYEIITGASLASLGRCPDLPHPVTLRRWVAEDPALAQIVHDACAERRLHLTDHILDTWRTLPPLPLTHLKQILSPLTRHESRLRNWPGRKHRLDR